MKETRLQMEKAVQYLADQFCGIISGAVTPGVIDTVRVSYHGQMTPIKHMASTSMIGNRIGIVPYDPTSLGLIEKYLREAGHNAYTFSKTTVMVNLPPYNIGAKEKTAIQVKKLGEEARVSIRNIRKKSKQKLALPENEAKVYEKELQTLTDKSIAEIDAMVKGKLETL